jgi:hypothetical protein
VGAAFLAILTSFSPGRIETFAIAGGALIAIDFAYKHANAVNPTTHAMQKEAGPDQSLYSIPDYDDSEAGTG